MPIYPSKNHGIIFYSHHYCRSNATDSHWSTDLFCIGIVPKNSWRTSMSRLFMPWVRANSRHCARFIFPVSRNFSNNVPAIISACVRFFLSCASTRAARASNRACFALSLACAALIASCCSVNVLRRRGWSAPFCLSRADGLPSFSIFTGVDAL